MSLKEQLATLANFAEQQVFFIVGVPKSGTTWLQQLLNAHPDINCHGESNYMDVFGKNLIGLANMYQQAVERKNIMLYQDKAGYQALDQADVDLLLQVGLIRLLNKQAAGDRVKWIGEKTPNHLHYMAKLKQLLPQAKFIHIIRDGRDCCVSGWHHIQRDTPEFAKEHFPTFGHYVQTMAKTWAQEMGVAQAFAKTNPNDYYELRYEDLLSSPSETLGQTLDFLALTTEAKIVADCLEAAEFKKLSGGREQGEEDTNSFYRKGVAGDWRQHFDDKTLGLFKLEAGQVLNQHGYSD